MKTRQYFKYTLDGKERTFLLMPNEFDDLKNRIIGELERTVPNAFEYFTGKFGAENVVLVQEIL